MDDIPRVSTRIYYRGPKGALGVEVTCPYCGRLNWHGVPSGKADADGTYGHRVADNCGHGGGYVLVAEQEVEE